MTGPQYPVDPTVPADQSMLLKLIDAKFETSNAKLDGISSTLTVMNDRFGQYDKRFEDHEKRIAGLEGEGKATAERVIEFNKLKGSVSDNSDKITDLEKWQREEQTTSRNASNWGKAVWSVVGAGVTAFAGFLVMQFAQAEKQPVHTSTPTVEVHAKQIERSVTTHN